MPVNPTEPLEIPPLPGLYIVTVDCDEPISVNASDLRIAEKCVKITRRNCKFGRAKNLASRYRNYQKTFSPHPVTFRVVALLQDINAAEAACGNHLRRWRIRGLTGRLNEWMAGISPDEIETIVMSALIAADFDFHRPDAMTAPLSTRIRGEN